VFRTAKVSNIVCRSVRAKVLARPGRLDEALALSDESLRLARVSDFLNAKVDAEYRTLARDDEERAPSGGSCRRRYPA